MDAHLGPALATAVIAPALTLLLQRVLNRRSAVAAARKVEVEVEAAVVDQWKTWSEAQGRRIDQLEADVAELKRALAYEETENRNLRGQVESQTRLLKSVTRWALALRDELVRAGGIVPATPVDVEAALTSLDPTNPT